MTRRLQCEELEFIARLLDVEDKKIPEHATPLTCSDLRHLQELGVRIENHGWEHDEIATMNTTQFAAHVTLGRNWLLKHLDAKADLYAVPFGLSDVPREWRRILNGPFFLADPQRPSGLIETGCWNRTDITHVIREH